MRNIKQIKNFLLNKYNLSLLQKVSLLRRYTNDVYRVTTTNEEYLLKIYGQYWRTEEELLFEVDLLNFLKAKRVKVDGPVPEKDGKFLHAINTGQFAILYEWAEGDKPTPPFNPADRELLGKATAKIHLATDSFKSTHHRRELGIDYLVRESLPVILDACNEESQKTFFTQTSQGLEKYLVAIFLSSPSNPLP